ncbi:MAG: hypothetical protein H7A23_13495 [Leptospiraceae bacterium]|nr:hypothetical protein [Leptospiraceae bacterium]MCP5495565.1 hypothetical protein [Leptospiraceae bacterium]
MTKENELKTITMNQASIDLPSLINYSLTTHDEVNITTDNGSVIILPQKDYETMQETLRLLSDKKSLEALLISHKNRDEGIPQDSFSIEEVFSDVQG